MQINRRKLLGLIAASAGLHALGSRRAAAETHLMLPIGMNLAAVSDWAIGYPFLNLMWGSRLWLTQQLSGQGAWDTGKTGTLALDDDGYPLEMPFEMAEDSGRQCVATLLPNVLSAGRYVILYDGEGELGALGATRIIKAEPGRVEIFMRHTPGEVEGLSIRRSVRGNHVRNIRVLPLSDEHADLNRNPYRSDFLDFCHPWRCLRFMDWLGTNGSIDQQWSDRKSRSFYTQTGASGDRLGLTRAALPTWQVRWSSGVALELCLELANLLQKDAWICVPHLADDDYITEAARLVKERLDPSLKVYLEFSNEIWNQQFLQAQWMARSQLAGDLVAKTGAAEPWQGGSRPATFVDGVAAAGSPQGIDHPARIGALFRRCFKLWEDVFSGADRTRLVRVCAVQADWVETVANTLRWVMAKGGCDALAPAGYFAPDANVYAKWEVGNDRLTADEVVADMRAVIAKEARQVAANAQLARNAGVRYLTYEGGQHIQPLNQAERPYNAALRSAQKHPAMYDLVRDNLDLFARQGCDLFCAYNSVGMQGARWGSWGHIEWYGQSPAEMPKYRAILDANLPAPVR
jgi:hypothetical protein